MLRALAASGGERKNLTVIFADISNSTSLIDRTDPEDAMRRMRPVIDAMKSAVESYDGVVNKVTGDGIMDIVTANYADNTVSVLMGLGNGSFEPQQIYDTGADPSSVAVGWGLSTRRSTP